VQDFGDLSATTSSCSIQGFVAGAEVWLAEFIQSMKTETDDLAVMLLLLLPLRC
jgi:hypothetical protein